MVENLIPDNMLCVSDRVAVGVSGGADSMLLLSALLEKRNRINFYIEVINVNHHLRGDESDRDSFFVENFCKNNGVDYKIIDIDVELFKKTEKKTVEESARLLRYEAIFNEMKKNKLKKLFLAHHAGDQAETILMHIMRGAGIGGASGIRQRENIFRPFMKLTKERIFEICKENNIEFVTDSSNNDNSFTRNYMRNVIIPEIQKIYPDAIARICSFGEKCDEIQSYIERMVNEKLIVEEKDFVLVMGEAFENESFIVREYLKRAFEKLKIFSDIEEKHFSLICGLYLMPVNSMLDMPHKITAKRVYSGVKFFKKTAKKSLKEEKSFSLGLTHFDENYDIDVSFISGENVCYGDGNNYLDYYKIPEDAVWRKRLPGDVFAKLGSGSKKLNDYFTDKKIEVDIRDQIPLLASKGKILLVGGYDIGEAVKLDSQSDKIIKITIIKK